MNYRFWGHDWSIVMAKASKDDCNGPADPEDWPIRPHSAEAGGWVGGCTKAAETSRQLQSIHSHLPRWQANP
jgi:hypothetical protein